MRFNEFLKVACPEQELAWRKYRRREARRRVEARMQQLALPDYAAYLGRLHSNPAEADGLAEQMRVTVSRFFREQERWQELARDVLPSLLANKPSSAPLRTWSAGCCGGEEPYTLALLWRAELQKRFPEHKVEILASDIDAQSLARARRGVYEHGSVREVPPPLLQRYFHKENNSWHLAERVKQMVQFVKGDIFRSPPPKNLDLVCCRYLAFTYFTGQRRLDAARVLHQALCTEGVLMIARKEEMGIAEGLFEPWQGVEGVFRKRPQERHSGTPKRHTLF